MKRIHYILILLILGIFISENAVSSKFTNSKATGRVNNSGTITFRNAAAVTGMPDTVGGWVKYISDVPSLRQVIPNVTYKNLQLSGSTRKYIDSLWDTPSFNPLRTLDSLVVERGALVFVDSTEVHTKGPVVNTGRMVGKRDVKLFGDTASQTITGISGEFFNLNLDNYFGADVVEGGGFLVSRKLELTRGELRNDADNNFTMVDSSKIIRHTGASIAYEPVFEDRVDVHYVGDGVMTTGPELPSDTGSLQLLAVKNAGGIDLDRDVTVNDSLYVGTPINGYDPATDESYTLIYKPRKNPEFNRNGYAEVIGDMKRTSLAFDGDTLLFNNPYTYTLFVDPSSGGDTEQMVIRVVPNQLQKFTQSNRFVERTIDVYGFNAAGDTLKGVPGMELGYGWLNDPQSQVVEDETNGLPLDDLVLQWYDGVDYEIQTNSQIPAQDGFWAHSQTPGLARYGHYAIGLPGTGPFFLLFSGRVMLEGALEDTMMHTKLYDKALIPNTPADVHPYNLDPNREDIDVQNLPENIVDWIVLGFEENGSKAHYITCFLRQDGTIVDLNNDPVITLTNKGVDSGRYQISVLHRNHLPVKTIDRLTLNSAARQVYLDFTTASIVEGVWGAMKPLYSEPNGRIIWGMKAGDITDKEAVVPMINDDDMNNAWMLRNAEGYIRADVNMNGIVNTEDMNYIQNNKREK